MDIELERLSKNDACCILMEKPPMLKIESVSPIESETCGDVIYRFRLELSMAGRFIFECLFIVDKVDEGVYKTHFSSNEFALLHDFLEVEGDGYASKIRFAIYVVEAVFVYSLLLIKENIFP